jgi:hypothetical protein
MSVSPTRSTTVPRGFDAISLRPAIISPILKDEPRFALVGVLSATLKRGRDDVAVVWVAGATSSPLLASSFISIRSALFLWPSMDVGVDAPCANLEASLIDFVGEVLALLMCLSGLGVVASRREVPDEAGADFLGTPFFVALDLSIAGYFTNVLLGVSTFFRGDPGGAFDGVDFAGLVRFDGVSFTGLAASETASACALPILVGLGVLLHGVLTSASALFGVILLSGSSHW